MTGQIFLAVFIIFSLVHLTGEAFKKINIRYATKPFLLSALGVYYYFSVNTISLWLIFAIIFGWLGDMFLMIPDPEKTKKFLKPGIAAFLIGHLFYIVTFFSKAGNLSKFPYYGLIIFFIFIAGGYFAWKLIIPYAKEMFAAVTAYVIIIVAMGISATLTLGTVTLSSAAMVISGASVFMISDTINGYNKFAKEIPNERIYTMSTYLLGQFLIVQGIIVF